MSRISSTMLTRSATTEAVMHAVAGVSITEDGLRRATKAITFVMTHLVRHASPGKPLPPWLSLALGSDIRGGLHVAVRRWHGSRSLAVPWSKSLGKGFGRPLSP